MMRSAKGSDRLFANSLVPDQTTRLIRVYTVLISLSAQIFKSK